MNLSIKNKLLFILLISSISAIVAGVLGLAGMNRSNNQIESLYKEQMMNVIKLSNVMGLMRDNRVQLLLALQHNPANPEIVKLHDHQLTFHTDQVMKNIEEITKVCGEFGTIKLSGEEKALADDFAEKRGKFVKEGLLQTREAVLAGNFDQATMLTLTKTNPLFAAANESVKKLYEHEQGDAQKSHEQADSSYRTTVILVIAAIIGSVLITIILGFLLAISIAKPLVNTVALAEFVASGDLNHAGRPQDLKRSDEIGKLAVAMQNMIEALKSKTSALESISKGNLMIDIQASGEHDALGNSLIRMRDTLIRIIGEVKISASNITQGAQQISSTAQEIAMSSGDQASSLEEIAASMEQIVDNAAKTEMIAIQAAFDTKETGESVTGTVKAMKEIAAKISIIQEIAGQTNLLAINAAIEAARAGEHGRGFAVVASEVQKLAERSQVAAEEITNLTATSMQVSEIAGQKLTKLTPDIQKTADLVQQISGVSGEQSSGAKQVNIAIQQLDKGVQSNAAVSEELAAVSEESLAQMEQMMETIAFFNTGKDDSYKASPVPFQTRAKPKTKTRVKGQESYRDHHDNDFVNKW